MQKRIIRIAAVLAGSVLLIAGCSRPWTLDSVGSEIRFSAGTTLLRDDAQTKATLSDEFRSGDTFTVFGDRVVSGEKTAVFGTYSEPNGVTVTASGNPLAWNYYPDFPIRSWSWESTGDWYDFAAVSPAGKGTKRMNIAGNLAISTHFNVTADNYDLLGTAYRRRGNEANPAAIVPLTFHHLTSAVCVRISNDSESTGVTVDRIEYRNLVVDGDAKITLDQFGSQEASWINTERNANPVRVSEPDELVGAGNSYDTEFDLMIPQRLDQAAAMSGLEDDMPKLILYYTPDGSTQKQESIILKNVCLKNSDTPISVWEKGTKYIYEIAMRLDGGLKVTITTTDWGDTIEAETPGLLIQ